MKDQILNKLTEMVYARLADTDIIDDNKYGYVVTWHVATALKLPTAKVRYWLSKLEKDGLVIGVHEPYFVLWSLSEIPGWVVGDYKYYFKKTV